MIQRILVFLLNICSACVPNCYSACVIREFRSSRPEIYKNRCSEHFGKFSRKKPMVKSYFHKISCSFPNMNSTMSVFLGIFWNFWNNYSVKHLRVAASLIFEVYRSFHNVTWLIRKLSFIFSMQFSLSQGRWNIFKEDEICFLDFLYSLVHVFIQDLVGYFVKTVRDDYESSIRSCFDTYDL